MESLAVGDVVLVPFPFSDLSQSKLRPAIVLAAVQHNDWILCQVTSNAYGDPRAVQITDADFSDGSLRIISFARPGKVFTANQQLIIRRVGSLSRDALVRIIDALVAILKESIDSE
ncbi:MAG: type II toxin-antitoxin system PemK/MazF family toxin [Fimbriimonadales bacterium]|nr:type II toxin-antitoxin system PemK/MazF family toxin [Fimbriimonadales bacterium]